MLYGISSPGSTPSTATLNTGDFTFNPFSTYIFDISNASGTAGSNSGWDLINSSGKISFPSTEKIFLDISAPSLGTGFNNSTSYSWTIAKGTSIKGFNPSNVTIFTSNFQPLLAGAFSVMQISNNIKLIYTPNTLPVTFTNITATQNSRGVAINWTVVNEFNIANYTVERSSDALNFTSIEQTRATGINNYQIEDSTSCGNTNYYRIKAMESDGKSFYSNIAQLTTNHSQLTTIYPNPVSDILNIELGSVTNCNYRVRVITISGKEVYSKKAIVKNSNNIHLNTSNLASGLYLIVLTDENGNKQKGQFVKK